MAGVKRTRRLAWQAFHPMIFERKVFPGSGISDQDDVRSLFDKIQIEQMKDFAFHLLPGLVMVEVERLDAMPCLQLG